MNVTVIAIIAGALGTVLMCMEKNLVELEISGRIVSILFTKLLGSARILRKTWKPEKARGHLNFRETPSTDSGEITLEIIVIFFLKSFK